MTELLQVSKYLSQAILLEAIAAPKPGLVTRYNNGSHKDMSIFTFMMSSAVLGQAFKRLQELGHCHQGSPVELFQRVRSYGIQAEKELLASTKGINTQRGILFAGGVLAAAAGYAAAHKLPKTELLTVVKAMTQGIVESELRHKATPAQTYGEQLFQKYGITGIRGEIEAGFPSVTAYGLPALELAFEKGAKLNAALVYTLLTLMTVVEDSNILWRTNWETALWVKDCAREILDCGSIFTARGNDLLAKACTSFEHKNISPGGCADLLSITITLYLLKHQEFPVPLI